LKQTTITLTYTATVVVMHMQHIVHNNMRSLKNLQEL